MTALAWVLAGAVATLLPAGLGIWLVLRCPEWAVRPLPDYYCPAGCYCWERR